MKFSQVKVIKVNIECAYVVVQVLTCVYYLNHHEPLNDWLLEGG